MRNACQCLVSQSDTLQLTVSQCLAADDQVLEPKSLDRSDLVHGACASSGERTDRCVVRCAGLRRHKIFTVLPVQGIHIYIFILLCATT